MAVTMEMLNVARGGKRIVFEDGTPAERSTLAKQLLPLIRKGFAVFVKTGDDDRRVTGYDEKKHEWIVREEANPKAPKKRIPAGNTTATVVAPVAGG